MSLTDPDKKAQGNWSRAYFIVAAILLALMALLWSVDQSIVYILLGGAVFFLFLGFWNLPRQKQQQHSQSTSYKRPPQGQQRTAPPSHTVPTLWDEIRLLLDNTYSSPKKRARIIILGVSAFIFSIFFIIIIATIVSSGEDYDTDSEALFQTAENFRLNGQYDSADIYYRQVLYERPDYIEALMGYGNNSLARDRYDSAVVAFDKVLTIDENYDEARYGKAIGYHYQKAYRRSLSETSRILINNPEYNEVIVLTGDNYYMQQKYDSAIYWYESAYGKGGRTPWLCHVMAYIYDIRGNQQKAIQLYQEALSYDSFRTDVYVRLGELFPGRDGNFYRTKAQQLKEQGY